MTLHRLHRRPLLAAAGVGLLAAALLFWATAHGVGASRDSCNYFHFARVLLGQEPVQDIDGSGPQVVLTHYPPAYPAMLAAIAAAGVKLLSAARLINVVSFATTASLLVALIYRITGSASRMAAAAVLVLTQPAIVGVHFWAVSEPPFFVALIVAIWCLIECLATDRPKPWRFAAAAGLALAAANFTRYIGGALFPAACVTVLLAARPMRERLVSLAWLVGCFAVPMATLAISQRMMLASVTHRTIEYHPLTASHWWNLLTTLGGWLAAPGQYRAAALWLAAIICVPLFLPMTIQFWKNRRHPSPAAKVAIPGAILYIVLLLLSVAFIDNATPIDDRLLAPVALLLLIWLVSSLPSHLGIDKHFFGRVLGFALALIIAYNAGIPLVTQVRQLRAQGFGFNHINFRNSPLVKACKSIPQNTPIYSNYPEAIFLHAGHLAAILPGRPTAIGRETGDPMEAAFERMTAGMKNGGYVAYFGFRAGKNVAAIPVSIDELKARIPLKTERHTKDGTLLKASSAATQGATTTAVP